MSLRRVPQTFEAAVAIAELVPHPRNPRRGDVEAIAASIRANGFFRPVIVQRSTRYILAGNHRVRAARECGLTHVPVWWVDVDDATALRILLVDNRTADLGGYDERALVAIVQECEEAAGLEGTGYREEDLAALIEAVSGSRDQSPELRAIYDVIAVCDAVAAAESLAAELRGRGLEVTVRAV